MYGRGIAATLGGIGGQSESQRSRTTCVAIPGSVGLTSMWASSAGNPAAVCTTMAPGTTMAPVGTRGHATASTTPVGTRNIAPVATQDMRQHAPDAETADVHGATADVHAGTTDVHAGTADVHAGTTDVHAGTADVHAGTTPGRDGTADTRP